MQEVKYVYDDESANEDEGEVSDTNQVQANGHGTVELTMLNGPHLTDHRLALDERVLYSLLLLRDPDDQGIGDYPQKEMAAHLNRSTSTVRRYMTNLRDNGYVDIVVHGLIKPNFIRCLVR